MTNPKILCIAIIFYDYEVIKKSVDFLIKKVDAYDLIIIENKSEFTEVLIQPYIENLIQEGIVQKYILFDKNITNNAFEVVLDSQYINLKNYDYILITDGDLTVDQD